MKTWKTEPCNEEQHVGVSEVTSPSLVWVISLGSVFSGEIFPGTYVSLVLFHDLKNTYKIQIFLQAGNIR